jgi:hypothetical protein
VTIGLGLGAYGLTQGLLQIPFGLLSDHIGRKIVRAAIICGRKHCRGTLDDDRQGTAGTNGREEEAPSDRLFWRRSLT